VTVSFVSGGPMVQSLIEGYTLVAFAPLAAASAQIRDGFLRALAVTSPRLDCAGYPEMGKG
jgi:tripartite-type tricarboxylate transporter receptor subunit TctC